MILSAILLQAGTNLINNYFEFKKDLSANKNNSKLLKQAIIERNIFISGLLCLGFFIPLWIYFIYIRGMLIFILGLVGLWGGYAYTGEPFVYKNKGLGPPLVFFLMGNLIIFASYYMQYANLSWYPWLVSIPISSLISLLLISNEIRDIHSDSKKGINTMSVRLGENTAVKAFKSILIITYLSQLILVKFNLLPSLSLLTLLLIPKGIELNKLIKINRTKLVFKTSNFHLYFGVILIITQLLTKITEHTK